MTYNTRVELGRDPRVLRAERKHDPPDTQIDARSQERRGDSQAADLHQEPVLGPLVLPAHDAPGVPYDLAEEAERHGDGEGTAAPRPGEDAEEGQQREGEER